MLGAAAAISIALPSGLFHGTRLSSGITMRFFSAPSAIDMPPP